MTEDGTIAIQLDSSCALKYGRKAKSKLSAVHFAFKPIRNHNEQEAQLSQRDRAAACLNFDKNISANSVHLTLLYVRALTSTNHHFTALRHHVCT